MEFITNTLYSFKDTKTQTYLFRNAKNDSLLSFVHKDSRVFETGGIVLLLINEEYVEYKIKNIIIHVLSSAIPSDDAIPYSYHVHLDVLR